MGKACCAVRCNFSWSNKDSSPDPIAFHGFPADEELKRKWTENIARRGPTRGSLWKPCKASVVCSRHFEQECYAKPAAAAKGGPSRLVKNAVPTLELGYPPGKVRHKFCGRPGRGKSGQQQQQPAQEITIHRLSENDPVNLEDLEEDAVVEVREVITEHGSIGAEVFVSKCAAEPLPPDRTAAAASSVAGDSDSDAASDFSDGFDSQFLDSSITLDDSGVIRYVKNLVSKNQELKRKVESLARENAALKAKAKGGGKRRALQKTKKSAA